MSLDNDRNKKERPVNLLPDCRRGCRRTGATLMSDPFLNYFALFLLFFVIAVMFYGIIAIHDIPHRIAEARHHPHQDAIHAAGWVSLFTLHVLWPFLWIWAMLYLAALHQRLAELERKFDAANQRELESARRSVSEPTGAMSLQEEIHLSAVIGKNPDRVPPPD